MFIGGLLDAFPHLADALPGQLEDAGFTDLVRLEREVVNDGTLTGTGFRVHAAADAHGHHHRHYSEIRRIIGDSRLTDAVKQHAVGIFHHIAEAEAAIHGKSIDDVAFHEVGAWDSIADIVCAASLIAELDASWSVSSVPLGRGQVKTAHGMLPVPAPATALMLEGFECHDDGIDGERVTPTGAAILRHLDPSRSPPPGLRITASGFGFGSKRFQGLSNVTRVLVFDETSSSPWDIDQVLQLEFEVDDQTGEEIAWGAGKLRETAGVLDVTTVQVIGKKGRPAVTLRVLSTPDHEAAVMDACFRFTTTLGIRRQIATRAVLRREQATAGIDGNDISIKRADRPGGTTVKIEDSDLARADSLAERRRMQSAIQHLRSNSE